MFSHFLKTSIRLVVSTSSFYERDDKENPGHRALIILSYWLNWNFNALGNLFAFFFFPCYIERGTFDRDNFWPCTDQHKCRCEQLELGSCQAVMTATCVKLKLSAQRPTEYMWEPEDWKPVSEMEEEASEFVRSDASTLQMGKWRLIEGAWLNKIQAAG